MQNEYLFHIPTSAVIAIGGLVSIQTRQLLAKMYSNLLCTLYFRVAHKNVHSI